MPSKAAYWPIHIASQHPMPPCVYMYFWSWGISALTENDSWGIYQTVCTTVCIFIHCNLNKFYCLLGTEKSNPRKASI